MTGMALRKVMAVFAGRRNAAVATPSSAGFGKVVGTVRRVRDGVVGTAFRFQLPYRKLASWIATLNQQRDPA